MGRHPKSFTKAAAPSRDQGGRGGPAAVSGERVSAVSVRVGIILIEIKAGGAAEGIYNRMAEMHAMPDKWLPVSIAPQNADLEVCVIDDKGGIHALVHPVHKRGADWVDAATKKRIDIEPTHWRKWDENR
jgi:hypothetical protein